MLNLIGIVLPLIVDLINTWAWIKSSKARLAVSILVCTIFGLSVDFITHNGFAGYHGLTLLEIANSLSESVLAMFGMAQLSYKFVWEKSEVRSDVGLNMKENVGDA